MTDQPAAIQGTFADFKIIRTRKLAQIIVEVPIEQADEALRVLGGLPRPDQDQWLALARLNGVTKREPEPKKVVTYGEFAQAVENAYYKTHPEEAAKKNRKWEDLRLSMQAGIRCEEAAFWRYLNDEHAFPADIDTDKKAADLVRWLCGVPSRKGLNDNPEAAQKWRLLDRSYQAWLKVAG